MSIIALCIEPGSVGTDHVGALADHLGLKLCDLRRFEVEIAERSDFGDGRLQSRLKRHSDLWDLRAEQLAARMREEVLQRVVDGDALIVGCSVPPIVRNFPHVARVLVGGRLPFRQMNAMQQLAYRELGTAEIEIHYADTLLDRFIERLFNCDWRDPSHFDLQIDAERVPSALQIKLLQALALSDRFHEGPGVRAQVEAAVDMLRMHEHWSAERGAGREGARVTPKDPAGGGGRYLQ